MGKYELQKALEKLSEEKSQSFGIFAAIAAIGAGLATYDTSIFIVENHWVMFAMFLARTAANTLQLAVISIIPYFAAKLVYQTKAFPHREEPGVHKVKYWAYQAITILVIVFVVFALQNAVSGM